VIGPKLGAGGGAEVYAWGDDAVVKLYRPGYLGHRAEAVARAKLDGHSVAPRLIDIVDCDGRPGLVLERLGGSDLLELLQRQPWRVLDVARAPTKARLAVHAVHAPGDLPDLRQILATSKTPPRHSCGHSRCVFSAGCRPAIACATVTFTPAIVLVAADRVSVIDWASAAARSRPCAHGPAAAVGRSAARRVPDIAWSHGGRAFGARPRLRADVPRRRAATDCSWWIRGWRCMPQRACRRASRPGGPSSSACSTAPGAMPRAERTTVRVRERRARLMSLPSGQPGSADLEGVHDRLHGLLLP